MSHLHPQAVLGEGSAWLVPGESSLVKFSAAEVALLGQYFQLHDIDNSGSLSFEDSFSQCDRLSAGRV